MPERVDDPILQRALSLGDEGDWEGMAEVLRAELEEREDDPALLCWLGVAERELGMDGVAYERFRRCLAAQPQDPRILATAGNAVAAFDDPEAESALRAASVLGSELPMTRWLYGAYLAREGLLDDAFRELDAAAGLAPEDPAIRLERGVAFALAGDLVQAGAELERSVELTVGDGWGLVLLGLIRVEELDLEEGAASLEQGARERPEDVEAQVLASLALAALEREDDAYEMLERGRIRAQGADRALIGEAESQLEEGPEQARRFLLKTLAPSVLRERLMTRP